MSVLIIEKDKVKSDKGKSIKKGRNKIVEILAKLKNQNLTKSKKMQSVSAIREFNL